MTWNRLLALAVTVLALSLPLGAGEKGDSKPPAKFRVIRAGDLSRK
jgi:hypothetical protein